MAGDDPKEDASQQRPCPHVNVETMKFFLDAFQGDAPVDEEKWIDTFLQKLQCFQHGCDAMTSFKNMQITYGSLGAATQVSGDLTFEHFWKASLRYFELSKEVSEDQACEEIGKIACAIHCYWAKALFRNLGGTGRREALEAALQATSSLWCLPATEVPVPSEKSEERFLQHYEAERQKREWGFVQEFAKIRSKEATLEDVEDTDGLEPDCFRYEAKGYPDETSSTLHPPSPAKNSLAGRIFGQHRFLALRLGKCQEAPQEEFHFLGRRYRALYWRLPDQVTYFAEEGDGLESLKVQDLMDRLVPLEPNQDMTLLKYNQRLQLSFSETRAEVQLKVRLETDLSDVNNEFCLSDGCGCISMEAAQRCALKLGFEEVPGVFQARCGPFKGLWVLDPQQDKQVDLIVRESQQKYQLSDCKEEFDFEVLKTSSKPLHSDLTPNSIQALESLGASPELFMERQQQILETLRRVFDDDKSKGKKALQELLDSNMFKPGIEKPLREHMDLEFPWFHPAFQSLCHRACAELRSRCCEELKLPLKEARRAWIVPDHTGTLQEGECFLQLPHHLDIPSLAGKEVLLIRAPCYHSSSVLKLRIPKETPMRLKHLVNVVVLNAWAERSGPADAEVMGGDHDGDTALAIWDQEFVAAVTTTGSAVVEAKTEVRELKRIQDVEPDQLARCLLAELPLAAKSHAAFCDADKKRRDWADKDCWEPFDFGFGEKTTRLAAICQAGVDCASNGRVIELPEDLQRPERSDWAYRGKQRKGAGYESERACGQLFRTRCRFHDGEVDNVRVAEYFSASQLGFDDWSSDQLSEATTFILTKVSHYYEQKRRILDRQYLSKQWKLDLEKALFRGCARGKHDYPEGLVGATAYMVWLSARTACKSLSGAQKDVIEPTLQDMLKRSQVILEPPTLPAKDIWRLFEGEILTARSRRLHGVCLHKPEESFLIDPVKVRFSHPWISPEFRSGLSLEEAVKLLISGEKRKRDFAKTGMPLPVRWYKGHWHTMGNRRLAVYRLYKATWTVSQDFGSQGQRSRGFQVAMASQV
ncbi:unnamed protein product [Cladocopium goreaui]|uniref:RNA-dependent RNA polymerase n=1 Tax=Cladocopium goreaui TaxID=2562237 RepID=A0A9P1DRN6_9DINO|nr:unnamed protein product [Cladocopium goreaui]